MRVLLSAFACLPEAGSETGAGWAWVAGASIRNECTVLVPPYAEEPIRAEIRRRPELNLKVVVVPFPWWLAKADGRLIRLQHTVWQARIRAVAQRLQDENPFDVAHHLTLSADWQPAGLPSLKGPAFVWGPVGGGGPAPLRLLPYMGARGLAFELTRRVAAVIGRRAFGDPAARRASVVLCQNPEIAARFGSRAPTVLQPNVALSALWHTDATARPVDHLFTLPTRRTAVYVGRLLSWKGLALALATLAQPAAADWSLLIVGEGPDLERLQKIARRHGVESRVSFAGVLPRADVRLVFDRADALLFPSLHEGSGWVVAEALARGCPVVALDHGGPPVLLERSGQAAVPVGFRTARALAKALYAVDTRPPAVTAWDAERLPDTLDEIYAQAVEAHAQAAAAAAAAQ